MPGPLGNQRRCDRASRAKPAANNTPRKSCRASEIHPASSCRSPALSLSTAKRVRSKTSGYLLNAVGLLPNHASAEAACRRALLGKRTFRRSVIAAESGGGMIPNNLRRFIMGKCHYGLANITSSSFSSNFMSLISASTCRRPSRSSATCFGWLRPSIC